MTREGELLNDSGDKASPKRDRSRKRAPRMTPVEMGVARVTPAAMTRVLPTLVLAAFAWLGCGSGDSGGSGQPGSSAQPRSSASMAEPPRNVRVVVLETSDLTETMTITGPLRPIRGADLATEEGGVVASLDQRKGAYVEKGQTILTLDRRILEAEMHAAEAARTLQDFNEERTRALHDENSVSGQEMLSAHTQSEQAAAQAEIARLRFQRAAISAPFAGVVAERFVELGEYVAPGTRVARLVDPFTLKLVGAVTDREVASLQPGVPASIQVEGGRIDVEGEVVWVGLEADPASGKIPVEIEVDNRELLLRPGSLARGEVPSRVFHDLLAIPRDAIQSAPEGPIVFVVEGDRAFRKRIRTGISHLGMVSVEQGLNVGDQLVVRGHRDLSDSSLVVIQERSTRPDGTLPSDPEEVTRSGFEPQQSGVAP